MSSPVDSVEQLFGIPKPSRLGLDRREEWRRVPGTRPRVLGHRGARHAAPENTLRAFRLALDEGADGIEIDVRMTTDGELVIAHDDVLPAEAYDGRGPFTEMEPPRISRLTASQLQNVRLAENEKVPTLREVLDFAYQTRTSVNVELKRDVLDRGKLVRDACALMNQLGGERILVSSFDPLIVRAVAQRCPDVPVAWLVHAEQRVLKNGPGWQLLGAAGVNPQTVELSLNRVRQLRDAGALVNVWTVNDPARARELAAAGVDGLITDTPRVILNALASAD
jgi:glycerophosphoryl diester phosphodiesterase